MTLHKLPASLSLSELRAEAVYSRVRLVADGRTKSLVKPFTAFEASWKKASEEEQALEDAATQADANVDVADAVLDGVVDQVDAVLYEAAGQDRKAAVYQAFFGGLTPFMLKRPTLGPELETMRVWPERIAAAGVDELVALGPVVKQAVADGDAASEARTAAYEALDRFYSLGTAKKLAAQHHTLREDTYAALTALRKANPKWKLPAEWADGFFRNDGGGAHSSTSIAVVAERVTQLQAKLQKASAQLADLQAKAAAAAQRKQEQSSLLQQAADAEKAAKEAVAKAKALKAAAKKK
jgi:hypothetical protein